MSHILAFGTGVLLRGLVADLAERAGMRLTMVSQTPAGDARARAMAGSGGRFLLRTRGLSESGVPVDEARTVSSIACALPAATGWDEALSLAADPEVTLIVSNVSESGFSPESGFPGRLAAWLKARFDARLPGPTILPCELIEKNGAKLKEMVRAASEGAGPDFLDWLERACVFCETLVDRICTQDESDPLAAIVEPYCFWAVSGGGNAALGALAAASDGALLLTSDLPRYMLRKVRILNGLHTAMASIGPREFGVETVREALEHPVLGPFLTALLWEEILPSICPPLQKSDAESFAHVTLSRMRNPFLEHRLAAIAVGAAAKWQTRLLPTMAAYEERFGKPPERLARCHRAFLSDTTGS